MSSESRINSQSEESLQYVAAHGQVVDLSSAVTLSPPAGASVLIVQAIDAPVRYTLDALTDPQAGLGFRISHDASDTTIISTQTDVAFIQEGAAAMIEYQWAY